MPRKREGAGKILDWEALEKAPNTHGAFSFLKSAAEIISIRREEVTTEPNKWKKESRSPEIPLTPRLCRLAQDAHSLGESVLYQMLWARGVPETDETRVVCMGWKTMHQFSRLTDKSCKRNTAGLIKKLAIEVIAAEEIHNRKGRTYRVFSYASILKRRKAAGFEWVSRDKARKFIQKDGLPFADDTKADGSHTDIDTVVSATTVVESAPIHTATVVNTTTVPMVATSPGTVVATTPPLGSLLEISKEVKTASSEEVELIVETLTQHAGIADSNAAIRLIGACRDHCPNATVLEIVAVIHEKAFAVRSRRDVRNPVGFFLATVPPVFEGEGIKSYRRVILAEKEAADRAAAEHRRNEEETRAYFVKERDRLSNQLRDSCLTDKRRGEIQKQVDELDGCLRSQDRYVES